MNLKFQNCLTLTSNWPLCAMSLSLLESVQQCAGFLIQFQLTVTTRSSFPFITGKSAVGEGPFSCNCLSGMWPSWWARRVSQVSRCSNETFVTTIYYCSICDLWLQIFHHCGPGEQFSAVPNLPTCSKMLCKPTTFHKQTTMNKHEWKSTCHFRNQAEYKYLSNHDLDEVIMPQNGGRNIKDLLAHIEESSRGRPFDALQFRLHFFVRDVPWVLRWVPELLSKLTWYSSRQGSQCHLTPPPKKNDHVENDNDK